MTTSPTFKFGPPPGTVDLLPGRAQARVDLAASLIDTFELHGYDLVTTPPFELAHVLERGLGTLDKRDLIRFVEPESGEVALLRPDITPQIARLAAAGLGARPLPYRIAYSGTVVRRTRGRARLQRQIDQVGVEYIGQKGIQADAEILALAAHSVRHAGLVDFKIELGHGAIARFLIDCIPEAKRSAVVAAITIKDEATVKALLAREVSPKQVALIVELIHSYGDVSVIARAARSRVLQPIRRWLRELATLVDLVRARGVREADLCVDLSDLRGAAYYTGPRFSVLADGPGEPLGAGGRYDDLVGKFGQELPATGFALVLPNLEWATGFTPKHKERLRFLVLSPNLEHCDRLRGFGFVAAPSGSTGRSQALAFARAWGYDALVIPDSKSVQVIHVNGAQERFARNYKATQVAAFCRRAS